MSNGILVHVHVLVLGRNRQRARCQPAIAERPHAENEHETSTRDAAFAVGHPLVRMRAGVVRGPRCSRGHHRPGSSSVSWQSSSNTAPRCRTASVHFACRAATLGWINVRQKVLAARKARQFCAPHDHTPPRPRPRALCSPSPRSNEQVAEPSEVSENPARCPAERSSRALSPKAKGIARNPARATRPSTRTRGSRSDAPSGFASGRWSSRRCRVLRMFHCDGRAVQVRTS
jgi:hypothetical protein